MTSPRGRRAFDWEAAGQELGQTLNEYHSIVVIGVDPTVTGRVAIGIARAQAFKRRVAVGDLFAESPPIQELVHTDDPHGMVDSFLYGVSLTKIAYEVPDAGQLFVMPSGTEPPDYDEILPNPRWHRLTAGFREVGALLVLAAPASAPHIEDLVAATDGAVLVGDAVPRKLPVATVISSVREPTPEGEAPVPPPLPAPPQTAWSRRRMAAVGGIVLTLILAAVAAWLAYRPLAGAAESHARHRSDSTKSGTNVLAPASASPATGSAADTASAGVQTTPRVANPGDSTQSVAFAVELMAANTQAGAIFRLQQDGKAMPAETFAPVLIQGAPWFKVVGGAYPTHAGADSLLASLGRQKKLLGGESVVRLPFAFLIDSGVPAAAVSEMVAEHVNRGQPIYGLLQANGTAWLLAGAFESPEQSLLYAESLRAAGTTPVLVYRKGRMF